MVERREREQASGDPGAVGGILLAQLVGELPVEALALVVRRRRGVGPRDRGLEPERFLDMGVALIEAETVFFEAFEQRAAIFGAAAEAAFVNSARSVAEVPARLVEMRPAVDHPDAQPLGPLVSDIPGVELDPAEQSTVAAQAATSAKLCRIRGRGRRRHGHPDAVMRR